MLHRRLVLKALLILLLTMSHLVIIVSVENRIWNASYARLFVQYLRNLSRQNNIIKSYHRSCTLFWSDTYENVDSRWDTSQSVTIPWNVGYWTPLECSVFSAGNAIGCTFHPSIVSCYSNSSLHFQLETGAISLRCGNFRF